MADQESQNIIQPKKRRSLLWMFLFPVLLILMFISFLGVFLGFNYFGERFLRKYLQEKVRISSDGLYHADFKTLHVNILTGKVVLDSFELIPDTIQYQRLKAQGKIARALYRISLSALTIDRVHFRQIYRDKRINFRQLTLERPHLIFVGFPDTASARRNRWQVVYEDLYPAVSEFFNDFHIDSVKVNHGFLFTSFKGKTGKKTTGEYEFSSVLRDLTVNKFSYYNHERVFYARDVDLIIHNFESQLADSLYLLKAEEIGFSLKKSILYGKKVSLIPNFHSDRIGQVQNEDLFRIDLPEFSIGGVDLYRAMTGREVEISSVNLTDFFVKVYRNRPPPGTETNKKTRKKITLAGLYTVVAKQLRFIAVDSLHLSNGSFEYFGSVLDSKPELRIGKVNLELIQFRLDSLTYMDQTRIFYSRSIELDLEKFSLFMRDGIHCINAAAVHFSTRKALIDVHDASIFPDRNKNLLHLANRQNIMFVNVPRLIFTGIDLKKVFNRRILDFDRLVINEPVVSYTRFRPPKNPDPRFKLPEDFFEAENEDVVYNLLKKYLWTIKGHEININQGLAKFSVDQNGLEHPLVTGRFDLTMQQFLVDSVHGMNEQGYFYSRDFDLDLQSVSAVSPDSLNHLWADRVHIATYDSLIEVENLRLFKSANPLKFSSRPNWRQSMTFEFTLQKLQLTGLNHKKLFLEKILKANQIVFDNPSLFLKTSNNQHPEGPPEESQLLQSGKFVHAFEIGHCLVRKGAISYNGEEDRKASYFSLKDIDFNIVNAMVHIPDKGMHDGLIKFDSLQLKAIPLRAVINDSTYALEARSLEIHSYPADIILQGIKVTPLQTWKETPGTKAMGTFTIPELRLNGFYFDRAIFDNQWLVNGLFIDHPSVFIEVQQDEPRTSDYGHIEPTGFIRMPAFMKTLAVDKISITGADAGLTTYRSSTTHTYSVANLKVDVTGFRVDSATRANPTSTPLFNAQDICVTAPGLSWTSSDSMYNYSFARFGFSTGSESGFLDSLAVKPNYGKMEFSRRLGYQTDRIILTIPRITVSRLDFRKLISERQLHAAVVSLNSARFESYRDKRVPFPAWQRPPMPSHAADGIKIPLCIDTITVSNGFASYEEQVGDEPGKVFFDRIDATLTGLSTQSGYNPLPGCNRDLNLYGTTRLMSIAPVEAWFHFQPGHPRDTFTVHGTIGELDLKAINPMLSKLMPASVVTGTAINTDIIQITGNSTKAIGMLKFRYKNLAIRLHPTRPGKWNQVEQSLLTEVTNFLLADQNPNEDGKMKNGIIYFERDPSKGFFNFLWKSVLSGLKSTMGYNSITQKNMIRENKHQAQEKQKEKKRNK